MGRGLAVLVLACSTPALAGPDHAGDKPPHRLLAAPVFTNPPQTLPAFVQTGARVGVAWAPVIGAARYHATWTGSAGPPVDVETTTPRFEQAGVAPGHYQLTVTAVDATGLEGALTQPLAVQVVELRTTPPGDATPAPPVHDAFAVGTRFSSPGAHCMLGEPLEDAGAGAAGNEIRATLAGATTLHCGSLDARIVIVPVVVATLAPPLPRDDTTTVHITVASTAAIGDQLEVVGSGDIAVGEVQRSRGGLDVKVTVHADATTAALSIQSAGFELGHVGLELAAPHRVEARPLEVATGWWALDLGGQVGGFFPPSDGVDATAIGRPGDPRDSVTAGPLFGARGGLFPLPRLGVEAETSMLTGGYADRAGVSAVLMTRVQLAWRGVEDGPYGLRFVGGAGLVTPLRERDTAHRIVEGEVHLGAAFTIETRPNFWLRLQALDVITPAQNASFAHCVELQVGLQTRLGRRDHW
jgi:hypothetical protein